MFISGVTVHRRSGDFNIYAKTIISSAGVKNTFKQLLPREIAANFRKSFINRTLGMAFIYIYIISIPKTWYNIS